MIYVRVKVKILPSELRFQCLVFDRNLHFRVVSLVPQFENKPKKHVLIAATQVCSKILNYTSVDVELIDKVAIPKFVEHLVSHEKMVGENHRPFLIM